ncbi:MAG: methyltransferase domain-containing protein [Lautropia sp.]
MNAPASPDFDGFVARLQCPLCHAPFAFRELGARFGRNGILSCTCSKFPVIEDVPILMKGPVGIISHWNDGAIHLGPDAAELVAMMERGASEEALIACLLFPRRYPLQYRLTSAGLWPTALSNKVGLAQTRSALKHLLARRPHDLYAEDLFRFFYSRRSGNNSFLSEYFLNRFVMPRYLSAMSLVQRLPAADKPVLDIACGYGQFEHFLTRRQNASPAIGIDFNFYQVWGAKQWVAPDAQFACCDVSVPLPFRDDAFSAVLCSDAFMLFPDKPLLLAQIERVAPGRPALFARCGNLEVGPPNPPGGGEMTPQGYLDFFGRDRTRLFCDSATWKDYLMRRNPLEQEPPRMADLRWEKYLSYLVNPQGLDGTPDANGKLPHGVGKLGFNQVLRVVGNSGATIDTEFMFRTIWGAYEDADMICYTQRWGKIDRAQLRRALADPEGEDARELIDRFVLVGMPERYLRDNTSSLLG